MRSEVYKAGSEVGERLSFSNGEYLVYEPQAQSAYTFIWSSGLPVSTLIDRTRRLFKDLDQFVEGFAELDNGMDAEGSIDEVLAFVAENAEQVVFFRFDAPSHAFGWKARVGVHDVHSDISINECGFIATQRFDADFCRSMIGELATETLGETLHMDRSPASKLVALHSSE